MTSLKRRIINIVDVAVLVAESSYLLDLLRQYVYVDLKNSVSVLVQLGDFVTETGRQRYGIELSEHQRGTSSGEFPVFDEPGAPPQRRRKGLAEVSGSFGGLSSGRTEDIALQPLRPASSSTEDRLDRRDPEALSEEEDATLLRGPVASSSHMLGVGMETARGTFNSGKSSALATETTPNYFETKRKPVPASQMYTP